MKTRDALFLTAMTSTFVRSGGALAEDEQSRAVGYVLDLQDLQGTWNVAYPDESRNHQVQLGEALDEGARVSPVGDPGRITIAFLDGDHVECPGDGRCDAPLRRVVEDRSIAARIAAAAAALFESPERFVPTMSRGDDAIPEEAVACRRRGSADITAALARLPAGEHRLAIVPLRPDGTFDALDVGWVTAVIGGTRSTPVKVGAVGDGLHAVVLPSGAYAWVFVVQGPTCARARATFDDARALAISWELADSARTAFLRATLATLAEPGP